MIPFLPRPLGAALLVTAAALLLQPHARLLLVSGLALVAGRLVLAVRRWPQPAPVLCFPAGNAAPAPSGGAGGRAGGRAWTAPAALVLGRLRGDGWARAGGLVALGGLVLMLAGGAGPAAPGLPAAPGGGVYGGAARPPAPGGAGVAPPPSLAPGAARVAPAAVPADRFGTAPPPAGRP